MMSASDTSSGSRLSRFGLYRTIDTRTEEFLRQSRKRQIRSGCICATVSTIITVLIVVVILLIYEYAIAVESNSVQTRKRFFKKNDSPTADGLHRSYFGFDQDYFERMPLLVNSLQETENVGHTAGQHDFTRKSKVMSTTSGMLPTSGSTVKNIFRSTPYVRRTSPRPFIFEYKSLTPTPFKKIVNSKSWVETYRNTQRLQNLHEIIKYLQNTINAKFGDVQSAPTTTRIEFSGILYDPSKNRDYESNTPTDLFAQSSNKDISLLNHKSDPLFTFKPESPGDVNLLADSHLRFSPTSVDLLKDNKYSNIPMFVPIANRKKYCIGNDCNSNVERRPRLRNVNEPHIDKLHDPMNTFKLMMDYFPYNHPEHVRNKNEVINYNSPLDVSSIYLTTSRPLVQFRRKTVPTETQRVFRSKRPRLPTRSYEKNLEVLNAIDLHQNSDEYLEPNETKNLILHINLYKVNETKKKFNYINEYSTPVTRSVHVSVDNSSNTSGVEDYHVGSSGVVPVEQRISTSTTSTTELPSTTLARSTSSTSTTTDIPTTITIVPFFDSTVTSTELGWPTNPPELVKFSHEDAKIPDEYHRLWSIKEYQNFDPQIELSTDINRRASRTSPIYEEDEPSTLSVKLKKDEEPATSPVTAYEEISSTKSFIEMTTPTYVPQINGHYRSVNLNPHNVWSPHNRETIRKRRLELSVGSYRKPNYLPSYVEIQRNNTKIESNHH